MCKGGSVCNSVFYADKKKKLCQMFFTKYSYKRLRPCDVQCTAQVIIETLGRAEALH